jgi:uncharacterized protein YkwD
MVGSLRLGRSGRSARTVRRSVVALTGALLLVAALAPSEASVGAAPTLALRDDLAWALFESLNGARVGRGVAPLTWDVGSAQVAQSRSWDMAARGYFAHASPEGVTAFGLLDQAGIPYWAAGENLAMNTYNDASSVRVALEGFVGSAPHAANLFNPTFNWVGVGAVSNGGAKYYTVVFIGAN